jgi:uncharacterized protein (DUF1697 family)
MPRYAAFLRGMNVGGHRLTNAELRALFSELGFEDPVPFRTSGNVVFETDEREAREALAARIEKGLGAGLGYEVPVFLREAAEVNAIARHEPFPAAAVEASQGKLQVLLLAAKPRVKARDQVLAHASDEDLLAIEGSELYWLPSGGISDSDLDLKAIGRLLGLGTMRTKGTIELIAAKHFTG